MDKFGVIVLNGSGQAEIGEVMGWTAEERPHPSPQAGRGRTAARRGRRQGGRRGRPPTRSGSDRPLLGATSSHGSGLRRGGDSLNDRIDDDES